MVRTQGGKRCRNGKVWQPDPRHRKGFHVLGSLSLVSMSTEPDAKCCNRRKTSSAVFSEIALRDASGPARLIAEFDGTPRPMSSLDGENPVDAACERGH
jgi:hypothetical protein